MYSFFFKIFGTFTYNEMKRNEETRLLLKMFLLRLVLLDIVNTTKRSYASKMLDIVGICVNYFHKTLVFKKTFMYFKKPL